MKLFFTRNNPVDNALNNVFIASMENDVKKIRDELGLTQQQLADIMGVTNITICRWETEFVKISPARMRHLELLRGKAGNKDNAS